MLKLKMELVPATSWIRNMRQVVSKGVWDTLRKETHQRHGYRCVYCEDNRKLHCHERWHYDDRNGTQLLADLVSLCPMCHHVKHIGNAEILAADGKLSFDDVVEHFCKVNSCTVEDFQAHRDYSFGVWVMRSNRVWEIDFGKWSKFVK